MFSGKPTRIITAFVVCTQIISSLFLSIALPIPTSLARASEVREVFEVSDIIVDDAASSEAGLQSEESDELEALDFEMGVAADNGRESYFWEEDDFGMCVSGECASDERASGPCASASKSDGTYAADELKSQGVIYDGDYRYTWYSQRILPGGGLEIEGRHVSDEGYVVDADERIVVASSDLNRGTELDVPFGSGKAVVLDTGCASGTIDIYTDF